MKVLVSLGAGKMGKSILDGIKNKGLNYKIYTIDPGIPEGGEYNNFHDINKIKDLKPDVLLLAIKPQIFSSISLLSQIENNCLVISIMAGISSSKIKQSLNGHSNIIRCMPNIAASVMKGITVGYDSNSCSNEKKDIFEELFSACGSVYWSKKEEDLHEVTALSGSGPAYFFAFVEALADSAKSSGLSEDFAKEVAIDTMLGAAELLKNNRNPSLFRENVTSKGGTTAAALEVFNKELPKLVENAFRAASNRSRELS